MQDLNGKTQTEKEKESKSSWSEQKSRMDDMLAKLKTEIQEVKSIDKDLTRQFISLGGIINQIKTEQIEDELDFEENNLTNEELKEEESENQSEDTHL